MKLNDAAHDFIGTGADGTLVTLNPDGSPQVSVVWFALQSTPDGDELVTAHLKEHKKVRNVRQGPRVSVTIVAAPRPGALTDYLAITGTARVVEGGAPELLTELAAVMLGPGSGFPPPGSPGGYLTRITIEKISGSGPWVS